MIKGFKGFSPYLVPYHNNAYKNNRNENNKIPYETQWPWKLLGYTGQLQQCAQHSPYDTNLDTAFA
jgi:hypothetical protein